MKKILLVMFLFNIVCNAKAFDFSVICNTGQTLYYTITSVANKTVAVVPQNASINANGTYYDTAPSGELTIPEIVNFNNIDYKVISLGDYVFYNCLYLRGNLIIPGFVTSIGKYAFSICLGMTGSLTIPGSVTDIGDFAFNRCSFTGVLNIPSSVKSIGIEAFYNCSNLTGRVTIPISVNSIGEAAFSNCPKITSLNVESGNKRYSSDNDLIYSLIKDTIIMCPSGKTGNLNILGSVTTIGSAAFSNCTLLTGSLNIPNSVKSIESSAFIYCTSLTGNLNIPNSVKSIGFEAFHGCSGFNGGLTISGSLTSIDFFTFMGCTGLTGSLTIPISVTSIGNNAFMYCSGLTSIYANAITPIQLGINVFYNVNKINCTLYVPAGSKSAYQAAEQWKDFVNIVEMTTAVPTVNKVNIKLYPNPVTEYFQIDGIEGSAILLLWDLNGQLLLQKQIVNNEKISIDNFSSGSYISKVVNAQGAISMKMVKK